MNLKYRLKDFPVYGVTSDFPLASIGFLPIITLQCTCWPIVECIVLRDPFVLESNQSGHPSSVSGDRIARCKRWIEREILKPSRLLIAFSMMFWLPRKKISSKNFIYKHAINNNAKQIESFSLTAGTYLSHLSM